MRSRDFVAIHFIPMHYAFAYSNIDDSCFEWLLWNSLLNRTTIFFYTNSRWTSCHRFYHHNYTFYGQNKGGYLWLFTRKWIGTWILLLCRFSCYFRWWCEEQSIAKNLILNFDNFSWSQNRLKYAFKSIPRKKMRHSKEKSC